LVHRSIGSHQGRIIFQIAPQEAVPQILNKPILPALPRSTSVRCTDDVASNLHILIEANPSRAKDYLKSLNTDERKAVSAKLVAGQTCLCVAFQQRAYDLMIFLVERCQADVNQIILGRWERYDPTFRFSSKRHDEPSLQNVRWKNVSDFFSLLLLMLLACCGCMLIFG